jgi:hypothetical protein
MSKKMGTERFTFSAILESYTAAVKDVHCSFATKIKSQVGFPYSEATHTLNIQTEDAIERVNKVCFL